jgi:hypothetical protein
MARGTKPSPHTRKESNFRMVPKRVAALVRENTKAQNELAKHRRREQKFAVAAEVTAITFIRSEDSAVTAKAYRPYRRAWC